MYNAILRSLHIIFINGQKYLMISQVIAVLLNIILNYFLIKKFGIYGAAAATSISLFFSLFISNLFFTEIRFIFWAQLKSIFFLNKNISLK